MPDDPVANRRAGLFLSAYPHLRKNAVHRLCALCGRCASFILSHAAADAASTRLAIRIEKGADIAVRPQFLPKRGFD
ncbi:hypothetical protein [Sphingopyxis sp. LK2115]|uniref:hypothetical protein n=1 Tax=Sphingopyxis sp. LK2115 TaxID=2744558 RepID=UPI001660089F|nr:hypothetical protein [Sphingopyxis sp. LK2115]